MLDRRHGVTGHQISPFYPAYSTHNNRDEPGDIEFDFWGERQTWYYNNNLDEVEFEVEAGCVGDCPSPLWGADKLTDTSPLLPSNLSPTRRRQIIEHGRKQLMDMVRNMPDSCYELSLKDLVDQQNSPETIKEKVVYEHKSFRMETETKKRKAKAGSLSRTASMEANHFLLKMFFPTCLSFKKKSTAEKNSREGSEKPVGKKWWIKRIFFQRNHKNREDNSNR
ncbi:hypothetical protein HRI_002338100 [Hibiscus trionum]|uniref:Uncharacterized protein n=1 Tax=Hibiscus trionum TaxID=183268 RepID=A0A9W7M3Q5_HIBTR|nr:hypothetical protein HRI_002338100 [Hibiscus trionum]